MKKKPEKKIETPTQTEHDVLTNRGHKEQSLGSGVVCLLCKVRKPKRGGWSVACPGDERKFMGAA